MADKKYADIINMEHPVSRKHPRMSALARAAQFAPFAALSGYEDKIEETRKATEERMERLLKGDDGPEDYLPL